MEFPDSVLLFVLQLVFAAYPDDSCMLLAELWSTDYIF